MLFGIIEIGFTHYVYLVIRTRTLKLKLNQALDLLENAIKNVDSQQVQSLNGIELLK